MGISKNKTKKKSQKENNHFKGSRNTTGLSKGFSQIQIHEQGNTNKRLITCRKQINHLLSNTQLNNIIQECQSKLLY